MALCIADTLYDIAIGNIDDSKLPDMSHVFSGCNCKSLG